MMNCIAILKLCCSAAQVGMKQRGLVPEQQERPERQPRSRMPRRRLTVLEDIVTV